MAIPNSTDTVSSSGVPCTIHECASLGCTTRIRVPIGEEIGNPQCRFCQANKITKLKPEHAPHEHEHKEISKEDFGVNLFECIKFFSARNLMRESYKKLVTNLHIPPDERKKRLDELKRKEAALDAQITRMIDELSPDEQREVLQRFEVGDEHEEQPA